MLTPYDGLVISPRDAFADPVAFSRERARPLSPDERREAILAAVVPLLREHGRDVSTRRLAEAAGVAEGTLFRAFGDKDSLIAAATHKIFDHVPLWAALRSIDRDLPLEVKIEQVVARLNEHFRDIVTAVVALGLKERPMPDPASLEHRFVDVLAELLEPDLARLVVPVDVVADYVRLIAFASALPMSPDLGSATLTSLISRGIVHGHGVPGSPLAGSPRTEGRGA